MHPFIDRLTAWLASGRRYLPLLFALPVLWHVVVLARVFAARVGYPMDAEWMEGGSLYHAWRWLHGQSIYGPAAQGFVPYAYPPGHFALLAGAGALFGLDYATGRAISIAGFVVSAAVLAGQCWRQLPRGAAAGALAALALGLTAAGFPVTGGWYDLCRNDTLALTLPVLAAGLVSPPAGQPADPRTRLGIRRTLVVAGLLVATVYTKQTGVFFAACICLYVLLRDWRRGLLLTAVAAGTSGLLLAVAMLGTDGWFMTWLMLMRHHKLALGRLGGGSLAVLDFAPHLYAVPALVGLLLARRWLSARGALWTGMLLAAVPASLLPHIKAGGFLNNLLPVVMLAGATTLVLLGDLVNGLRKGGYGRAARGALAATLAAAALLLIVRRYDVAPFLVTPAQRQRAVALNQLVRGLDGGVFIPMHPFLAARNGVTTPQVHAMAQWDAYSAGLKDQHLFRRIEASTARWLLLDTPTDPTGHYVLERAVEPVTMMIGHKTAPAFLLRRRSP